MAVRRIGIVCLVMWFVIACSGTNAGQDVPSDFSDVVPSDIFDVVDSADSSTQQDGASDSTIPDVQWPTCEVPAPRLGNSPEAMALAQAPQRCGQASHQWLSSPMLGSIVSRGEHVTFSAATLRAIAGAASSAVVPLIQNDVAGDVIEYMTQDRGSLVSATGFIAYPSRVTTATTHDIILLLHGTSGFTDTCAPSNDGQSRALAGLLASMGYIVIAPDYIGLRSLGAPSTALHSYLVGQATAIASLDSVRAAMNFFRNANGPLCATTRYVALGGSQGGHAALWVDRLAPYYAPEYSLLGTVATVPPANLTAQINLALQSLINATSNTIAMYACAPEWYGYNGQLSQFFVAPYDTQVPAALRAECRPSLGNITSLSQVFQPNILAAAQNNQFQMLDPWGCIAQENSLATTSIPRITPTAPGYGVLFVLGGADELVNTPIERQSFQTLCSQGMRMQYLECEGARHVETTLWSLLEITDFVRARFAGTPMSNACPTTLTDTRCSGTP